MKLLRTNPLPMKKIPSEIKNKKRVVQKKARKKMKQKENNQLIYKK